MGSVVVVDDLQDIAGPLTAVKLAREGAAVKLVTRWPMVAMETMPKVYVLWTRLGLIESDVEIPTDLFPTGLPGPRWTFVNIYASSRGSRPTPSCSTPDDNPNGLNHALRERGVSVEAIGDATAPRGTYEAI